MTLGPLHDYTSTDDFVMSINQESYVVRGSYAISAGGSCYRNTPTTLLNTSDISTRCVYDLLLTIVITMFCVCSVTNKVYYYHYYYNHTAVNM